jgi:hypothetical protein
MEYYPDGWMIVKISGTDPHYRIFCSWRGGFVSGDSWRLNSGVKECEKDGKVYKFSGYSGSTYYCHEDGYGRLGAYNLSVLRSYEERSNNTFVAIEKLPNVNEIDWKCGWEKMKGEVE